MDFMIGQFVLFAQNEMYQRDLLVAAISVCLGLNLIYAAATNNDWTFQLGSIASLEEAIGRTKTRLVIAFVGTSLLGLGAHLVAASRTPEKSLNRDIRSKTSSNNPNPYPAAVVLHSVSQTD